MRREESKWYTAPRGRCRSIMKTGLTLHECGSTARDGFRSSWKSLTFPCLILFATENKRYATSTAVASPEVDNMGRYAIVPRGGKPYIFGFGSEVANERINCSWIKNRAYPAHTTMFGALPASWGMDGGHLDKFEADLRMVMEENHWIQRPPSV